MASILPLLPQNYPQDVPGKRVTLRLERKHVQSLCVNREKGTEKKAELNRSHMLSNCKALSHLSWPMLHDGLWCASSWSASYTLAWCCSGRDGALWMRATRNVHQLISKLSGAAPRLSQVWGALGHGQGCSRSCGTVYCGAAPAPSVLWLPQLQVNLWSDGSSAVGGQTLLPQALISLLHFTSILLALLDSSSKLSLAFLKSHRLPACPTTLSVPNQPLPPLGLRGLYH